MVPAELDALVKKTKVLINVVGPYHLYGTAVVEACAKNGTHYLDVTGEGPWVFDMIRKYHETAKANGAIVIPEIGFESSPSDLLTWALVDRIRRQCQTATREVIASLHEIHGMFSSGTFTTALTMFDNFSIRQIADAASGNWATSPVRHKKPRSSSLARKLLGVRSIPYLGIGTTLVNAGSNVAIVQRSWGLLSGGNLYGQNFEYFEYVTVRNRFVGAVVHISLALGLIAVALPPVRWLLKKLVSTFVREPPREVAAKDAFEYRAIATADQDIPKPRQAIGRFRYDGGIYYLTGVFLAEAAMVLLKDDELVKRLGGGLLTPAMLGQHFIDRLIKAGVVLETDMLPE